MKAQSAPTPGLRRMNVALWAVQALLAAVFAASGAMKLFTPVEQLVQKLPWVQQVGGLVHLIGAAELAGALGVLLPALTRIKPGLTTFAALGLATVMVLATGLHVVRGEFQMLPVTLVLGGLAAFVAWGRTRAAPIPGR